MTFTDRAIFYFGVAMKKFFALGLFLILGAGVFSEGSENHRKFVSGNIQDKILSVRSASGDEAVLLSKLALGFAVSNKGVLGSDRDLDALAVSGILALPGDYVSKADEKERNEICEYFYSIYTNFSDVNVKTAILNRLSVFKFQDGRFPLLLNAYLKSVEVKKQKDPLTRSVIGTLGTIGDRDSFVILYLLYGDPVWAVYREDIKPTLAKLMETSVPQAISIVQTGSVLDCRQIFDLAVKNEKFSNKTVADISENVLLRTIDLYENDRAAGKSITELQFDAYSVLARLKWTRANAAAMKFFSAAKKEYEQGFFAEDSFVWVIKNLPVMAPVDSVAAFCSYLNECNSVMESAIENPAVKKPQDKIVLALISALGAVGDKNAFDTLLAVTYYSYSETVLAQARDALASLKW